MDERQRLIDLPIAGDRQGPGGATETRRAIELSGLETRRGLQIADVGCGTGASTLVLAAALDDHWRAPYAEVGTASSRLAVLERNGYAPIGYFALPQHGWLDACYRPMQQRFDARLSRHGSSDAAKAVVAAEDEEMALYERCRAFVGDGCCIARKTDAVA